MGLFDYVHYEGKPYQTKDLDMMFLHDYYIENNRLLVSTGHREDHSDAGKWKKEHPGEELPPELDNFLSRFAGCGTWFETGREDTNYHGMLYLTSVEDESEDLIMKFTDGELVEVKKQNQEQNQENGEKTEHRASE